jgi:hypothetical protein
MHSFVTRVAAPTGGSAFLLDYCGRLISALGLDLDVVLAQLEPAAIQADAPLQPTQTQQHRSTSHLIACPMLTILMLGRQSNLWGSRCTQACRAA